MSDFEREDLELKAMMGDQFIDITEPITEAKAKKNHKCREANVAQKPSEAVEAEWHPIKERTWMDDLKDVAKSTAIFGGLNVLIWYWEIEGLMDHSIALPCMIVSAVMAGIGIGKVVRNNR